MSLLSGPFAHDRSSTERVMLHTCLALLPSTAFGLYLFGWPAINLFLLTCAAALAGEAFCLKLMGRPLRQTLDGSALLTGWLLAVSLPPWAPWWIGVGGSLFGIIVGKHLYGGLGQNLFNPAMLARVALLIAFPLQMTHWALPHPLLGADSPDLLEGLRITFGMASEADGVAGATALGGLKTGLTLGQTAIGCLDSEFSYLQAFLGFGGGSLGETSELLIVIGGLYLLALRIIHWHVPLSMLATVALLAALAHLVNPERYPGALYHLLSGGLLLGAFFIATEPVTSPVSRNGRLLFGAGCGVLVYVIRTWGNFPEAVAFAVLFMNALTPLIDRYLRPRAYGRNPRGKPLIAASWTRRVKEVDKV